MSALARSHTIAHPLAIAAPAHVFVPVCRWDHAQESGSYVASCGGRLFTAIGSKTEPMAWCRHVSSRERARHPAMSRLLGG
jgi:hypothetical protein